MNNPIQSIEPFKSPTFSLIPAAKEAKELALASSALVGRVKDADTKIKAVRAMQELKGFQSSMKKAYETLNEPILTAGRSLRAFCATEVKEVDAEYERVQQAVSAFDDEERCRIREEEQAQQRERDRIEAERQAELKRIADEQAAKLAEARRIQAEIDAKARKASEEAARLATEATNKKQREVAKKALELADAAAAEAHLQRQNLQAAAATIAAESQAKAAEVETKSGDAAWAASRPIERRTVSGARTAADWEIIVTDIWKVASTRPDLVKLELKVRETKDALNQGCKIEGLTVKRVTKTDVRATKTINI